MIENVTLSSNCDRESVEQIMKNYFVELKRFFNISSTKNKICRLNLCDCENCSAFSVLSDCRIIEGICLLPIA